MINHNTFFQDVPNPSFSPKAYHFLMRHFTVEDVRDALKGIFHTKSPDPNAFHVFLTKISGRLGFDVLKLVLSLRNGFTILALSMRPVCY